MENNKKGELSLQSVIVSSLLIALFVIGILTYLNNLSDLTGTTNPLNNNNLSNELTNLQDTVYNTTTVINSSGSGGFFQGVPVLGSAETIVSTIFGTIPKLFGLSVNLYLLVMNLLTEILGIPAIVLNVMLGILTLLGVLLGWRVYKAGS